MICTFNELRDRDVINVCDGKRLGFVCDMEIDAACGKILKLIVPCGGKYLSIFGGKNTLCIPYSCIERIGKDAILVRFSELVPVKK